MLTNATVKAARDRARPYRLVDEGGLFLHVIPAGRRTWRMRCWLAGKEILLTFGRYPDVSLGDARELRDATREQLALGRDPRVCEIAQTVEVLTFGDVARRWHDHMQPRWTEVHAGDVLASLERDVLPVIGAMPIAAITPPVVLSALRSVEQRGRLETARRVRQRISAVFCYAIVEGWADVDPAAIVGRALMPPAPVRRQPALLDIGDARQLLAVVDQLAAAPIAKLASRFLALTAVRLAAVRGARWSEIENLDGPAPMWRVPAARMKLKKAKKADPGADHLVPLSRQAVEVLFAARAIAGAAELVFPGRGGVRPIGEGAIGELYDQAGYAGRHVPHGWRATFSTILNELDPDDGALIERALAHAPKDKVKAAYDRAAQLARLRVLLQRWGDLLVGKIGELV